MNRDRADVKQPEQVYAEDRQAWRDWLQEHHDKEKNAWLIIYHKKSKTPSVAYNEAVEEALCFGWIDSKPNKRDHESYLLFFAKRNPKSNWSRLNRERAERMLEQGRMTPAGLEMIETAKHGTWNVDGVGSGAGLGHPHRTCRRRSRQ